MDRRQFVASGLVASFSASSISSSPLVADDSKPRKRIAFLGTEVREHSHAQHFLDRLGMGFGGLSKLTYFDIAAALSGEDDGGYVADRPERPSQFSLATVLVIVDRSEIVRRIDELFKGAR